MKKIAVLFFIYSLFNLTLLAQQPFQINQSVVTIEGTSSLHKWKSEVTNAKVKSNIVLENGMLTDIISLELQIPSTGIISDKGKKMDHKTWTALKAEEYPTISYSLVRVNSLKFLNGDYVISSSGDLTVAGVKKNIELNVQGSLNSDGTITFEGRKELRMTDFEIDPPTALLGALKTGNDITVQFKVTLEVSQKFGYSE